MIFTFYKAQGLSVGSSLVEEDKLDLARELMEKAKVGPGGRGAGAGGVALGAGPGVLGAACRSLCLGLLLRLRLRLLRLCL